MQNAKRIAVLVSNDLYTDRRVQKVCDFLHRTDYAITLIGRRFKDSLPITDRPYTIRRFRLWFTVGPLFYANLNFRLFLHLVFSSYTHVLANDLDTLFAAYLAKKIKGFELIYDSHEYYCGVPELENRPKIQAIWRRIECWIFPKLTKVYTVNQSIATLYQKEYNLPLKVVRNIAPKLDSQYLAEQRVDWPYADKKVIVLQGAGINVQRGAEEAVEAMQFVPNAVLLIIGSGDVLPLLKSMVKKLKLEEKVFFKGRMPYLEMMAHTYRADVGLSLDKGQSTNYQLSLPNKIFDYIQANTPVIVSPMIEVKHIVESYGVGEVLHEVSVENLAKTLQNLLENTEKLAIYKQNCIIAAQELCWENEEKVLKTIYS